MQFRFLAAASFLAVSAFSHVASATPIQLTITGHNIIGGNSQAYASQNDPITITLRYESSASPYYTGNFGGGQGAFYQNAITYLGVTIGTIGYSSSTTGAFGSLAVSNNVGGRDNFSGAIYRQAGFYPTLPGAHYNTAQLASIDTTLAYPTDDYLGDPVFESVQFGFDTAVLSSFTSTSLPVTLTPSDFHDTGTIIAFTPALGGLNFQITVDSLSLQAYTPGQGGDPNQGGAGVPEPASAALLLTAFGGLALRRVRRQA